MGIAFRGTQGTDLINFRRNLYTAFWPVSLCAGCEAHKGFWRNFVSLRPEIYTNTLAVATAIQQGDVMAQLAYVTVGMSMGGPLALLAGYHLKLVKYPAFGTVVFGCPRFGNTALASSILENMNVADSIKTVGFA